MLKGRDPVPHKVSWISTYMGSSLPHLPILMQNSVYPELSEIIAYGYLEIQSGWITYALTSPK